MTPADEEWLPVVARRLGRPLTVTARTALTGGYVADAVVRVDLDGAPPVVVKRTTHAEVAAMRALAVVHGVDRPRLLAAGRDWVVTPFYDGPPLAEGPDVPDEVWATLARVHAHWLGRRPRGVPVVDAAWWQAMVTSYTLPAVQGAHERTGDPSYAEVARLLTAWTADPRLRGALAVLPRTLTHGDAHRGNVLLASGGAILIDWGNARVAPAGLDLAVLAAQGAEPPAAYHDVAGQASLGAELREVERHWAQVQANVQYLGFAADHLGVERVVEMLGRAAGALAALGPALTAAQRG